MVSTASAAAAQLQDGAVLLPDTVVTGVDGAAVRVHSNNADLLAMLAAYFARFPDPVADETIDVLAVEHAPWEESADFSDWPREAGKSGRKDSFLDLADGRMVHKVRTGMRFLQSNVARIASGPCLGHPNQVVNFINSQCMNWLQQRDWLLCHAAAVAGPAGVIALAGLSGGGKSTLMLQLLDATGLHYVTNDRLLIKRVGGDVVVRGIPKWPRVNPGTIVGNPRLHPLLTAPHLRELQALPAESLWNMEEKHDVPVDELFGPDRIALQGCLRSIVLLNWQRASRGPVHMRVCEEGRRQHMLHAVMKDSGPFYCDRDGRFAVAPRLLEPGVYEQVLSAVPIHEVCGRMDFMQLRDMIIRELL